MIYHHIPGNVAELPRGGMKIEPVVVPVRLMRINKNNGICPPGEVPGNINQPLQGIEKFLILF